MLLYCFHVISKYILDSKTIRVTYLSEPKVKAEKDHLLALKGSSIRMRCIITEGIPPAKITWLKQRTEIQNSSNIQVL